MARGPDSEFGPVTHLLIERLTLLRDLLRRGGGTADSLAEELGVSERTVRRYLEFVRNRCEWPVRYDARRARWLLEGDPPALPAMPLSDQEVMALLVAARALEAYRDTPYAPALRSGFAKILNSLDARSGVSVTGPASLPVFDLDPAREVDPQLFARLLAACRERRRLELTYRTQERNEVNTRQIDPYHLLNHAGDWYLIGHCHLRGGMRDFAVGERMLRVGETGDRFEPDPRFDLQEYLRSGFSLFRGGKVEDVVLRFSPAQAPYMRERVWDETEVKDEQPGGGLLLRMRVRVNIGLLRFVLRYGAEVEVLQPEALRRQVAEEHRRALALYGE